jgi:hypothetical protein
MKNCLILLAFLCCSLAACGGGPDYTKPGSKGEKLPEVSFVRHYGVIIHTALPLPLACGKVYKIAVRVFDPGVKCEGYNFEKLYDPAKALAARRIQSLALSCLKECSPLQQRKSSMRWQCQEVGAHLDLQVSLICPKPGAPLPADHNPTGEELATNGFSFPPGADPVAGASEEITQTLTLPPPCPGKQLFTAYYEEHVPNLANLINTKDCTSLTKAPFYKTYVERGETLAREYYNSLPCPPACTKAPFQVFRQEWNCDHDGIVVTTYFYIDCRK